MPRSSSAVWAAKRSVDLKRTAGAVLYSVTGKAVFGGSTITQQLIKNLTGENQVTVKPIYPSSSIFWRMIFCRVLLLVG